MKTLRTVPGFVFKLGVIQKPLSSNNEKLQSQLDEVKEKNKTLMARLERLEAIVAREISIFMAYWMSFAYKKAYLYISRSSTQLLSYSSPSYIYS